MEDKTKNAIIEAWRPALDEVCKITLRIKGIMHEERDNAKRAALLRVWRAALLGVSDCLADSAVRHAARSRPSDDTEAALAAMLEDDESLEVVNDELEILCQEHGLTVGDMLGE